MGRKHILLAVLLILANFQMSASAQSVEAGPVEGARAVLQRFLDLNKAHLLQSPEAKALLTGEALERWEAPYWGKLAESPDRMDLLREGKAVGRVQWFGANEQVTDFYFYLTFDGTWKLEAMRHLALTGVVEMTYLGLKKLPNPTEEHLQQLGNMELVLASDEKLRRWFTDNEAALKEIVRLLGSSRECSTGVHAKTKCALEVQDAIRKVYLNAASKEQDGDIYISIGGMTDNVVGFLYSPLNKPPQIDPSEFIWVERVADRWYLYRTT